MRQPPTGTVTFLFTDIQGSTRLWEQHPDAMRVALARHDELLRRAIEGEGGFVFKTVGDAFCAAFADAPDALLAALAAQRALQDEPWGLPTPLAVRMGLHTGAAEERGGDYFGPPLNRVARLMAAGHGGQTLLSGAAHALCRDRLPAMAGLRDLGPRRLKDLGRPEPVFQLTHPSLPADFPSLKSLDNPDLPNNLPQQTTSFIGREREIADVEALLSGTRLLTLTGAGGAGKTRLALQAAADLLDRYFDGVWLVELAALSDPALVPQAVAQALGVREEPGRAVRQSLTDWLKPRCHLLLLDNCEHLVGACASLTADLLRACPDVHVLATSREPLGVAGEQTYRMPSLSLPDPRKAPTALAVSQSEAARLFIERAQAVRPGFAVSDADAPAVAQVCAHLDGIPLAIELAAARLRVLSVAEVNGRLSDRFRLLTGGSRTALPRQQTLRALIDWSHDLLSGPEKALLRRLSVFSGGWTLAGAEAVCAGDGLEDWEILDLLTTLVDKSLALAEPAGVETRFRLLETVREYAGERLAASGEAGAGRDRHLAWCLGLAAEAEAQSKGPEQGLWLGRLEAEHDNLRAGLTWAGAPPGGDGPAREMRLAGALWYFWLVRGHWTEGRARLEAALARAGVAGGDRERAKVLNGLGAVQRSQGDWAAARTLHEQSLALHRALGDRAGEAGSLNNLGLAAYLQGDSEAAGAFYAESLAIHQEIGYRVNAANNLHNLGLLKSTQGDWEAARDFYEQALALHRALGNRGNEAGTLHGLGALQGARGDWDGARACYDQALALHRAVGDRGGEAGILHGLGMAACQQGDWETARALHEQALAIHSEIGDRYGEANSLDNLGLVARAQGDPARARDCLSRSLALRQRLGNPRHTLETLEEWAALALTEGDAPRAARLAGAAQAGREAIPMPLPPEQADTHARTLAAARAALGESAFSAAWDAGQAMTMELAVGYALGEGA